MGANEIGGRVFVAVRNVGDVAEAEGLAIGEDRRFRHGRDALQRSGDPDRHALRLGLEFAGRRQRVLLGERIEQRLQGHAERGELGGAQFDENPLGLIAVKIDLGHVGHALQTLAQRFGDVLELCVRGAVPRYRIEHRIDVAQFVVDRRPDDVGGQIGAQIRHLLAQFEEQQRHVAQRRRIAERERDRAEARLGVGGDLVDPGELLQLFLDAVGDLVLHVLARRAGPDRADDGGLDGEVGILGATEPLIGEGAAEADGENQEGDQLGMADRPMR